jgi:hypothetical protein
MLYGKKLNRQDAKAAKDAQRKRAGRRERGIRLKVEGW